MWRFPMKYGFKCPKCNFVLEYGMERCPNCNVRLSWENMPKPEKEEQEKVYAFNDGKYLHS